MMHNISFKTIFITISIVLWLQGCASVNTFPTLARAGNTVTMLIGGSDEARKETTSVVLTDVNSGVWDLSALGLVRSVFNVQMDAKATGQNYSSYIESFTPWAYGHELLQTVLITDLPANLPVGAAVIEVNTNTGDNSALLFPGPSLINIEIVAGVGQSDQFSRRSSLGATVDADFSKLEPAPYAKVDFGAYDDFSTPIGAVSLVVDFDEAVIDPADINVYVPSSTIRGTPSITGQHGDNQHMVHWRQDGLQVFIDIIAPGGINQGYLDVYVIHPPGVVGAPNFSLTSTSAYTVDGVSMVAAPSLSYHP